MRKLTKQILKKSCILAIAMLAFLGVSAQKATNDVFAFNYTIANDVYTAPNILEFDLYLLDTDVTEPFEMATVQAGIFVNAGIYNGGTITASILPGTSQLNASQQPTSVTFTQASNIVKLASKAPPGIGSGTIISTTAPGTRVCRIRLTNTASFTPCTTADLTFCFTTSPYPTKVSIYTGGLNTPCPMSTSNTFSNAVNVMLNCPAPLTYNVTGGGSYCQGGVGLPVGLDNSEAGTTYTLYKDGVPQVPTVAGTGAAISFGNQLAGTYTVSGTGLGGTTPMSGSAIITETPNVVVSVNLAAVPGGSVCSGTTVTYTATPSNEGATPTYQWYVNAAPVGTNSPTYVYEPVDGDQVSVVLTSSLTGCVTGNPATSNVITMSVIASGPAGVSIAASANPSCGTDPVTFTATPVMGGTPTYQWYVNTLPVGTNSETYTYVPTDLDQVYVVMTSSLACATGNPVTSNTITMGVTVPVTPTITIATANTTVCEGLPITFTSTGSWGGLPTYQWYVNSLPVGTNADTYTYYPVNNDIVTLEMTASLTCTTVNPVTSNALTMTVNPAPVPTISGTFVVCEGSTGNVYTTEAGMTGYSWFVSANGTITAGGTATDNTVTVTWNTPGPGLVRVNYADANSCNAITPTENGVTVIALPVPTISGPTSICGAPSTVTYTTEPGMFLYTWVLSAGGTISAGGTPVDNYVTVDWASTGAETVSVSYTNVYNCTAAVPTVANITIHALPVPTIAGPAAICEGTTGNVYTTEAGMSNYVWNISAGGIVTAGGSAIDNTVTVTWNVAGPQTVSVIYTDGNSCTAAVATVYTVTVNALPVPTISGPASICETTAGNVYTTEAGMTGYAWIVSAGGTITAGGTATDNTVTVTWNAAGPQTVSVNYQDANLCSAASATVYNVTVNPLPVPTISGPASVCETTTGSVYTTEAGMTGYAWVVSAGGTITAGGTATDNTVTVTWNAAGPESVSVNYTDANTCTAAAATVYTVAVNPLPVPTIAGPATVCATSTGNVYTTEAGMTGYAWVVSAGGTITAGGTATDNTVTVTWNTAGPQTVSVNYVNTFTCTAPAAAVYNVTVNPLPVPGLTGPVSICQLSTGNVYTTDAGMTGYSWVVSAGGTITAGGTATDNTVTVTWNTTGPKTVSVNYINANLCSATAPTVLNVTVNALPVPTVSGPTPVGVGTTNVYTTEAGMTSYVWTVSAGGTITAGGTATDNTVTVLWNVAGAESVSVNYNNASNCTATTATVYPVSVISIPPAAGPITGTSVVCQGSMGIAYSIAPVPNATGYVWTLPAGATIASGANTNAITVDYSYSAVTGAITVYGTNTYGNGAPSPAYNVTVNAAPVPTITGPTSICSSTAGNVYTTEAGMTNYVWAVSAGGTITAGGTATDNTVTVSWTGSGAQTVSVSYTNGNGCTAATPTVYNVAVGALPVPTITGDNDVCESSDYYYYTTEPGMTNYVWNMSPNSGTITWITGSNQVMIFWNSPGAKWVSVSYTNPAGCTAAAATVYNVTVEPLPGAAGTITGTASVCAGSTGITYSVAAVANATSYAWTVPAGATIASGATSNVITVNFGANATSGDITVVAVNACGNGTPSPAFPVTIAPVPAAAGAISGPDMVCQGTSGVIYSVAAIANATGYDWTVPDGATIVGGDNTATITVDFSNTASSGQVTVAGTNDCGTGAASSLSVAVNPVPPAPVITQNENILTSSAPVGNQWYFNGDLIPGATAQTYEVVYIGTYYCVVTINGCSSDTSNNIYVAYVVGTNDLVKVEKVEVYPNPNDGRFTLSITTASRQEFDLRIFNNLGVTVFEKKNMVVDGNVKEKIDLPNLPDGVYSVSLIAPNKQIIRKIVVN